MRKIFKCLNNLRWYISIFFTKDLFYFYIYLLEIYKKIKIGKGCRISILADISGNVITGDHVRIERWSVIKGNVEIGDYTLIRAYAYITTNPTGYIKIGKHCHINLFNVIGRCKKVIIKDHALFATGVKITDSSHNCTYFELPIKSTPIISEDVIIEKNVWLGFDVCVIIGGGIRRNSIIGAKPLVNKKFLLIQLLLEYLQKFIKREIFCIKSEITGGINFVKI